MEDWIRILAMMGSPQSMTPNSVIPPELEEPELLTGIVPKGNKRLRRELMNFNTTHPQPAWGSPESFRNTISDLLARLNPSAANIKPPVMMDKPSAQLPFKTERGVSWGMSDTHPIQKVFKQEAKKDPSITESWPAVWETIEHHMNNRVKGEASALANMFHRLFNPEKFKGK